MKTSDISIHAWISENHIKNEKGEPITFDNHLFLYELYRDRHANFAVKKAAQVGLSTLEIIKNHFDAKHQRMDIIYTLPTDNDVSVFVGGKVNRIIQNNPCMMEDVDNKDSIEQKAIGQSMEYFRGTWTKKSAIMVTADRLVHDEKDSSKQDVVADYQARTQHSKLKQTHVLSHPSVPNNGVDAEWQKSDMKEYLITCGSCGWEQTLTWNTEDPKKMSIDIGRRIFVCKKCKAELSDDDRAVGRWLPRRRTLVPATPNAPEHYIGKHAAAPGSDTCNPETCREWSAYHISLLMAPWVTAGEIIDKYNDVIVGKQTMEFFYNKVLGEPYAGSGNVVTEDVIMSAVNNKKLPPRGRLILGVDSGVKIRWVLGKPEGLLGYGECSNWDDIEGFLKRHENLIAVIDQGGDIIGPRELQKKYPGRVFLCHYARDRKTQQLIRWGKAKEFGTVLVDRNRMMQSVIDRFVAKQIPLWNGLPEIWYNYWLHWSHIYRVWNVDTLGVKNYEWKRSDRDDWVHATVYCQVGLERFGGIGSIDVPDNTEKELHYNISPDATVSFNPDEYFRYAEEDPDEWR